MKDVGSDMYRPSSLLKPQSPCSLIFFLLVYSRMNLWTGGASFMPPQVRGTSVEVIWRRASIHYR